MRKGAPALFTEIAEGMHFDPVQRLTFLEHFEYRDDRRVQGIVRQKATALRTELLAKLQQDTEHNSPSSDGKSPSRLPASGSAGNGAHTGTTAAGKSGRAYTGFGSSDMGTRGSGGNGSPSGYVGFGSSDMGAHGA